MLAALVAEKRQLWRNEYNLLYVSYNLCNCWPKQTKLTTLTIGPELASHFRRRSFPTFTDCYYVEFF